MKFEIKSHWSGAVLFSAETDSLKLAVELAVKSRANLAGAYLARANLAGADLAGAYLAGAYIAGANLTGAYLAGANGQKHTLIGNRPVLVIGPLGSRCAYLTKFMTDAGVYVRAGCFWNTLDAFKAAVAETHGDNNHGREYRAAIALIEAHAELWTPAKEKAA
jgi:hypothetical protein